MLILILTLMVVVFLPENGLPMYRLVVVFYAQMDSICQVVHVPPVKQGVFVPMVSKLLAQGPLVPILDIAPVQE
jgi:hypothetical protein